MSRKPPKIEPTQVRGELKQVAWLPRDIKTGWTKSTPAGELLMGWDQTSDSLQLWKTVSTGPDAMAEFIGYVCQRWDGGPGL